ncbi:MAG: SDR family oxidoreductase [bacterium]|nr:SDR family oxidoreductase [bacterium]
MAEPVLSGRSAIVTGASQGLGREIARGLLAASADVAICARTATDLASAEAEFKRDFPGRQILAITCDIARRAEVDHLFEAAFDGLGNVDIVVNNAGVHGPIGPIEDVDWDAWLDAIAINLAGTAYCCREGVKRFKMRKQRKSNAKIIVLSGGGATSPQPGLTAYGASKAGLVRFTEALADEVREFGIDVNAVAPGALVTRMLGELRDAGPNMIGAAHHGRVKTILAEGGGGRSRERPSFASTSRRATPTA